MLHWKKKWSHFDLKSWVTGGTKIWPGIPSNWRIFELYWLKYSPITRNPGPNFSSASQRLNFLGQNYLIFSFSVGMTGRLRKKYQLLVIEILFSFQQYFVHGFWHTQIIYLYTYKTLVTLINWLRPCVRILDTEWLL